MKNYIQQLIELFGNGNYSSATQNKVRRWLVDEEHGEEKKEALYSLWKQAGEQTVSHGMQQSVQRMRSNIGAPLAMSVKTYRLMAWKTVAALLLGVSMISIYLLLEKDGLRKDLIECHIPLTEIRQITLPDGTRVMLNSKSTLLYPEKFTGRTRSVYLIGEACFQVKPDKEHPFIVKANDFQVTALGTEFNVNAYPEKDDLIATLLEGSIKVDFNNLMSSIILKPNEQVKYNKYTKDYNLQRPKIENVTAWQRGELVFSNMHLEDIFTSLERKFPYAFVYSRHSLKTNSYSFRFQKQATMEDVMTIITQVVGDVEYVIKGNKCYITNKK